MRKEILMSLGVIGLLYSSTALAQTCTTTPNCETLGFSETEADCAGGKMLKCPFDLSKVFCDDSGDGLSEAKPGDIYYSDGTVSENVISGKTPVGIVAYNKDGHRFVIALEETGTRWGGDGSDVACLANISGLDNARLDFSGKENTLCLLSDTEAHPAAKYCNSYKPIASGKGSSGWYLPAAGELYAAQLSYDVINISLQKLSRPQLSYSYHWSSSETSNTTSAWVVGLSGGYTGLYGKSAPNFVRCVLEF